MRIINGVAIKFRIERRIARHTSSEHVKDVVILYIQENKCKTTINKLPAAIYIDPNNLHFLYFDIRAVIANSDKWKMLLKYYHNVTMCAQIDDY